MAEPLPIQVEICHYPESYDGPEGDALGALLSEVAGAMVARYPDGLSAAATTLSDTRVFSEVARIPGRVQAASSPAESRRALVAGVGVILGFIRMMDEHAAAHGASAPFPDYDMELTPPVGPYFGPRHDIPLPDRTDRREILAWLRGWLGRRMGRTTNPEGAAPPAARLTLLRLGAPDFDALEAAILARFGVSLVLGACTDTVAGVAEAIADAIQQTKGAPAC